MSGARAVLGASLLACLHCKRAPASGGEGQTRRAVAPPAVTVETSPARAWPLPIAGRGVAVGPSASSEPLALVMGDAARTAVADRCPDHDECVRIANNGADVARASCDAQCSRCCPHESADDCVRRECAGACRRCADAGCRVAVCNDVWLGGCRDRCAAEARTCAGCRDVWCADERAMRACHADAKAQHEAELAACERDCAAGERRADGSCAVVCGTAKKARCSKGGEECPLGKSPDCRCECTGAVGGSCVSWNAVCACD